MTQLRVGDSRLAYDEAGTGLVVVFSHAGLADRRMWGRQFADLARDHRVVRYDWRGVGESDGAAGSVAHHEDLLGLLDALHVDRAVLVGCSMGGAHALDAALVAPERVSGLVLISSGLSGHVWPAEMAEFVGPAVAAAVPGDRLATYRVGAGDGVDPDDVLAMALVQAGLMVAGPDRSPGDVDPQVWALAVDMLCGVLAREWRDGSPRERHPQPPASGRLHQVGVPTVVVNALLDLPWVQQVADRLTVGIPDARRVDVAGAAHLAPLEAPVEVNRAVRDLVRELGR